LKFSILFSKSCYHLPAVDEDGIAEAEVKLLLRREGGRMDGPREDIAVIGRQEAVPHGVGIGAAAERGGDQSGAARISRRGEGQRVRDAALRQLADVAVARRPFCHRVLRVEWN